jgi:hypothetical protein
MTHLTFSSCVLTLALIAGATASHAAPLPVQQTSQSDLTVLVGRGGGGGGFGGGGRDFGGDGGFARSGSRVIDDGYRGDNWRGGVYIGGGGGGYSYCGAYPFGDWPRGTCDQF